MSPTLDLPKLGETTDVAYAAAHGLHPRRAFRMRVAAGLPAYRKHTDGRGPGAPMDSPCSRAVSAALAEADRPLEVSDLSVAVGWGTEAVRGALRVVGLCINPDERPRLWVLRLPSDPKSIHEPVKRIAVLGAPMPVLTPPTTPPIPVVWTRHGDTLTATRGRLDLGTVRYQGGRWKATRYSMGVKVSSWHASEDAARKVVVA